MGLDMYWELPEGTDHPAFHPKLHLTNCWYLDEGSLTFGDYAIYLSALSGVPTYDKYISEASVKEISERFDQVDYKVFCELNSFVNLSLQEWNDLKRMFEAYAKIGGRIGVSW
jgi:hypothetical protein